MTQNQDQGMQLLDALMTRFSQVNRALRTLSIQRAINHASAAGRAVSLDAGLTVRAGERPSGTQVGIAALHAREEAATLVALQATVLARVNKTLFWTRACVVLLLLILMIKN